MVDLHPDGIFDDTEILDHGFAETKGDEPKLYFWVKFETEHGKVFGDFYLTEKAADYTLDKILSMGYEGKKPSQDLADGTKLRGNIVQVTVEHDTYNNNTKAKVGFVNVNNHVGGPTRDDKAAENASAFDAMFRKKVKEQVKDDDDVPF